MSCSACGIERTEMRLHILRNLIIIWLINLFIVCVLPDSYIKRKKINRLIKKLIFFTMNCILLTSFKIKDKIKIEGIL